MLLNRYNGGSPMLDILMADRSGLGLALNRLGLKGSGAEVGVYRADFAVELLNSWHGSRLYLVDPWEHLNGYLDSWNLSSEEMQAIYQHAAAKLAPYRDRVEVMRMTSDEAALRFGEGDLDFVYIDANHGYTNVLQDLKLWFKSVRIGGLVSGHDYFNALADENLEPIRTSDERAAPGADKLTSYGVKAAVDEFCDMISAEVSVTYERLPSWYFVKTADHERRYSATMQ